MVTEEPVGAHKKLETTEQLSVSTFSLPASSVTPGPVWHLPWFSKSGCM